MKLIVGLGNPGVLYAGSRHNVGWTVVEALSGIYKVHLKKDSSTFALSAKVNFSAQFIILAMPLTFMNLSGIAVKALLKKYRIKPDRLLVVCDDLDLELGRQKVRPCGSSGGHRGLKSIIESLKDQGFARLRIGIGRPAKDTASSEYVLSPFNKREKEQLNLVIERAVACAGAWLTEGTAKSMNMFNRKEKLE